MKRHAGIVKVLLTAAVVAVCWIGTGWAAPVNNEPGGSIEDFLAGSGYGYYQNSGVYLFTAEGSNDARWFYELLYSMKHSEGYGTDFELKASESMPWTDSDGDPGTWGAIDWGSKTEFYTAEDAKACLASKMNQDSDHGSWGVYHLSRAGHGGPGLDVSPNSGESTEPVPEPASMFLIGIGLAGIAGINRKNFRKKN